MPIGIKGFQKGNKIGRKNSGKKHNYARHNPQTFKRGHIPWHKGTKGKIAGYWLGKKRPPNKWKKNPITPKNKLIRESQEYKLWRKAVFERDDYTCIWCGRKDKTIQSDHIKPFAFFPELRFAIDNGRTLCRQCHKTTSTWGINKYKNV